MSDKFQLQNFSFLLPLAIEQGRKVILLNHVVEQIVVVPGFGDTYSVNK